MKNSISYIVLFIAMILAATGCCKKELNMEDASKAYLEGNYKEAAGVFLPKAKKGDPEAQVNIAFMYYCGMHVKQDFTKAAEWYTKAAERNHPNAQFSLATLYENGEGVEQDFEEAYFWYSLAEGQGDKDAGKLRKELEGKLGQSQVKMLKERIEDWKPL